MSEDIFLRALRQNPDPHKQYSEDTFIESLLLLEDMCVSVNKKHLKKMGLISLECDRDSVIDIDILREKQYDVNALQIYVAAQIRLLINHQRLTYDSVIEHVWSGNGGLLFLDAQGGTGKTFLLNLILAKI
ncbi:uncharacterized protein TNCV_2203131 [Trichonephila clavipes]|uniref:ATP-dependent DNA helicase n=1 Tax=Trichonephila clavipes TaxID=2585209 RepID=A0A8X6S8T1_TRICX|nr:uncharacterized protein TNCV_2203131 [Trichonephila clavipes]